MVTTSYMAWHLVSHALFKSTLFMVVGLLLHAVGIQDSRAIPSVTHSGTMMVIAVVCIYQSYGWTYTPTWVTKKIALDTMGSMGPSALLVTGGVLAGVLGSVAYTTILAVHVMSSGTATAVPAYTMDSTCWAYGMGTYAYLLTSSITTSSGMV